MTDLNNRIRQAQSLIHAGEALRGESILHQLLYAYPDHGQINFILGLIALEAGVVIEAEALLIRAIQAQHDLPHAFYWLGFCYLQQNRFSNALKAFESAISLNPNYSEARDKIRICQNRLMQSGTRGNSKEITIALLTTVWKRHALTRFVLGYYHRLKIDSNIKIIKLAVGSEQAFSRNMCESLGWAYIENDNRPLSNKWQAGLNALKENNPDYIITIGSDDILTENYFGEITKRCPLNGCTGIYDFWFIEIANGRMGYWNERKRSTPYGGGYIRTLGAGRCYSRQLIEKLDWKLWPKGFDNKLDGLAEMKMIDTLKRKPTCYSMQNLNAWAIDIKSNQNLWDFDDYQYSKTIEKEKTKDILMDLGLTDLDDLQVIDS